MRLGQKNLVYSMALAGIMLLFLVGYFIYMLPYLYVDYMMEQNLKSVREQHDSYMEYGTYEGVQVKNSTACFSLEIPMEGNYILVTGKVFSAQVRIKDERLRDILERCREKLRMWWRMDSGTEEEPEAEGRLETERGLGGGKGSGPGRGSGDERESGVEREPGAEEGSGAETDLEIGRDLGAEMEELGGILKAAVQGDVSLPVEIRLLNTLDMTDAYYNESVKAHFYSGTMAIIETSIEDASNQYITYMAVEQEEDRMVMSFLPVVAPELNEIRPVVLQSLPMLGAVIMLMVMLFSRLYSKGIVTPIVDLVRRTEQMKNTEVSFGKSVSGKWYTKDEVGRLADTLDDFYLQIREGYQMLEEKNRELAEKNKRQEIFLQSSSHQLKTPIAAALLLVEGMMDGIGRYKDTEVYLPKVKEQLLSMRTMVEDILYLNRCEENMRLCQMEAVGLLKARLRLLQVAIGKKRLSVRLPEEESLMVCTDEKLFSQILDNLLSNAVKYTPEGGRIEISLCREPGASGVRIENSGVTVPEELLPHIYEPFVSGSHKGDPIGAQSHGLGLYIAAYYARKLGITLSVQNGDGGDGVVAMLIFGKTG